MPVDPEVVRFVEAVSLSAAAIYLAGMSFLLLGGVLGWLWEKFEGVRWGR